VFEWFEAEVRALEERRATNPFAPGEVAAFYGSSSIRLWTTLVEDFDDVPVINLGFGGSTLAACAYYFERVVVPCRPKAIVVYAGENDLGDGAKPDAVVASFRELHAKAGHYLPDTIFTYLAIKPSPTRWAVIERIREVNRRIAAEIEARDAAHPRSVFVDVHRPMLQDDGTPRRELWTEDGIHMTRAGYRVWWQVISAQRRHLGF
jgi:lysophospholipase L1-like esterase